MISRRKLLGGLAGLTAPTLAGCGSRRPSGRAPAQATASAYAPPAYVPPGYTPAPPPPPQVAGLDAVIDISHMVQVSDFAEVRRAGILAVIHKSTEGGDYEDRSYAERRGEAEAAGLLWGAYHFGTHQYSGVHQAQAFLAAARPGRDTLMALDFEPNDGNPRNSMDTAQAEAFVHTVQRATGRLPLVYTHPRWANGERFGRGGTRLREPVSARSILARCDLWLADLHEQPEVPEAWAARGWRFWQYAANESAADAAYGSVPRAVPGITHCDRNLFNGDTPQLYRYWKGGTARV